MNTCLKISTLLSLLFLGSYYPSMAQAPITGPTIVCAGTTASLSDTDPSGIWSSSNTFAATIDPATGTIYAEVTGSTVITYSSIAGVVTATVAVESIPATISGPSGVCQGNTITLSDASPGGTWTSSNSGIASVDINTGVVSGVAGGPSIVITYTTACGIAITPITVTPATTPITGTATSVCSGYTITLSDATAGGVWSVSNTAATVTGGLVIGNYLIVPPATYPAAVAVSYSNGCGTATYNVTVNQTPAAITGLNSFCFGSTSVFTTTPAGGAWTSGNLAIATINGASGNLTAGLTVGTTAITYTAADGCIAVLPITVSNCPSCPLNSNFELGDYTSWNYYVGTFESPAAGGPGVLSISGTPIGTPPPPANIPCDFALTGPVGAGAPVVVTGVDPWGGFPVVGDGVYSLRIGSDRTNYHAEKATYYVHIPPGSGAYALIYRYAVVLESPMHVHADQPSFTVQAFDSNTSTTTPLPCADFYYAAQASDDPPGVSYAVGFLGGPTGVCNSTAVAAASGCTTHPVGTICDVFYHPWATATINLTGLGGHTIIMSFVATDCSQSGHFGYAYVDMTCGTFAISSVGCGDSIATVSAPSGFANYTWYDSSFGTLYGTTQTVTFPMPRTATTYAVILQPSPGFGCPDTLYTRIAPSNLQLHPAADTTICKGQSTTLSAGATDIALPLTYSWSPATGLNCTTCATPVATPFAGTNVYNVTVTDVAGCSKSVSQTITVDSVAGTVANTQTSCYGVSDGTATVTPTSGAAPYAYSWNTTPPAVTAVVTGLPVGIYVVTITDHNSCTNTESTTIIQPPVLAMAIGGTTNPTTCSGHDGTITLTGLVPGATDTVRYLFTAAASTTTIVCVGSYTVNPAGAIVITGFPLNLITGPATGLTQGSYDSITIVTGSCPYNELGPIVLTDPPNPALPFVGSNAPICVGSELDLSTSDVTPGVTYNWTGPNLFTATLQTPIIGSASFADSGYYIVNVTVNNCSSKDSTKVIINGIPVPTADGDTICSGGTIKLISGPNGQDIYLWNGPNGFISNLQNPEILNAPVAAGGVYTITVTYKGCSKDTTTTVVVNQTPEAPLVTDTSYCQYNFPPAYIAPPLAATGTNLLWYTSMTAQSGVSVAPAPSTQVTGVTTWYVTQTSSTTPPCTSPRTPQTVGIYALPHPQFNVSDSVYCVGTYFTFNVSNANTGVDYQGLTWYFGSVDSVQNVNPIIHAFGVPGPVTISTNIYYRVCPDTVFTRNVMVYPYPLLHLGNDTSICPGGESVSIGDFENNTNPLATWLWSTGETTSHITIVAPGTYYNKVTINGCTTTDTITVANDCYMNIPNVFTPNGDGVNDYFYPRQFLTKGLTSFSMNIYNRWGQLVFTSTSIDGRGWDGSFNGVPQSEGVFVYVIDATFKDGQKEHHQGNITLLR